VEKERCIRLGATESIERDMHRLFFLVFDDAATIYMPHMDSPSVTGKKQRGDQKKRREKIKQNSKIHANLFQDFCGPLLLSARKKSKKKKKDILTPLTHNSQCIARAC
jgi:hypothetical protein